MNGRLPHVAQHVSAILADFGTPTEGVPDEDHILIDYRTPPADVMTAFNLALAAVDNPAHPPFETLDEFVRFHVATARDRDRDDGRGRLDCEPPEEGGYEHWIRAWFAWHDVPIPVDD